MILYDAMQHSPYILKEHTSITSSKGVVRFFLKDNDMTMATDCLTVYDCPDQQATLDAFTDNYLMANLWVSSAGFNLEEKNVIAAHLSDAFSMFYFGQSPCVLCLEGTLLNAYDNTHRQALTLAYKNIFRLSQVARMGICPSVSFVGYTITGAMLQMVLNESSAQQDSVKVSIDWLVSKVIVQAMDNLSDSAITNTSVSFTGGS